MRIVVRYLRTLLIVRQGQLLIFGVFLLILPFQNCSQGYRPREIFDLPSAGVSGHISHDAPGSVGLNEAVSFSISGTGLGGANISWSHVLNGASSGCVALGATVGFSYSVSCSATGNLRVTARITADGLVTTAVSEVEIEDEGGPGGGGSSPSIVVFRVPAGTGTGAWNTPQNPIKLFIGQTLRVFNDEPANSPGSVANNHRIHTNGDPFSHGQDIAPGASMDHVTEDSVNPTVDDGFNGLTVQNGQAPIYDHNHRGLNTPANIFIVAYDGFFLYQQNCASCHSPIGSSTKRGRTGQQIFSAINGPNAVPAMNLQNLRNLSRDQIDAIAWSLGR